MRAKICIYIWGFENFPVQKPLIFLRVFALKIQNHCRRWGILNRIEFLITWNCRHLANATIRDRLADLIDESGLKCPIICTPEELMEDIP